MNDKDKLIEVTNKLIELGEDKDELLYWQNIFDDLSEDKQKEVIALFEEEFAKLS